MLGASMHKSQHACITTTACRLRRRRYLVLDLKLGVLPSTLKGQFPGRGAQSELQQMQAQEQHLRNLGNAMWAGGRGDVNPWGSLIEISRRPRAQDIKQIHDSTAPASSPSLLLLLNSRTSRFRLDITG